MLGRGQATLPRVLPHLAKAANSLRSAGDAQPEFGRLAANFVRAAAAAKEPGDFVDAPAALERRHEIADVSFGPGSAVIQIGLEEAPEVMIGHVALSSTLVAKVADPAVRPDLLVRFNECAR